MSTKIEWATETWNPITGCSKISEGCANCYAERMAKRLAGRYGYPTEDPFRVTLHDDRLGEPLRWRKPRRVFVCSMSDIFHDAVDDRFLCRIFDIMLAAKQHTFLVLTKRPERMRSFFARCVHGTISNLWLGVTAENQQRADERIPILLQIPAAVRFVSVEPMLGPVDLISNDYLGGCINCEVCLDNPKTCINRAQDRKIDWVICGGETGPNARPMRPDWVRSLRDQCTAARTPFFFKSWGNWVTPSQMPGSTYREIEDFGSGIGIADNPIGVGKKRAGRLLDGREWNQYPEVTT